MNWRYSLSFLIIICFVYFPGLSGGFIYDDYSNFLQNKAITDADFSLDGLWAVVQSGLAGPLGRPIPILSFFLNYELSGTAPFSYKIFNLIIHIVNTFLIYFVVNNYIKNYF